MTLAAVVMLSAAGISATGVDDVLGRIEAAEASLADVALKFRQETRLKATGDVQVTTGDLALQRKPERFRVRFASPVEQTAVFDGTTLQLHIPDSGQAFRQKATAAELERLIGLNPVSASASFRRGTTPKLLSRDAKTCRLEFTRPGPGPATAWKVKVNAVTWLLEEAVLDSADLSVKLVCTAYRVNRGLPARTFTLALPKGTEVQDGLPQLMGGPR